MAADIPLALSGGASAAVIWALAASHPGIAGGVPLASATGFSSVFLFSSGFEASRVDLRWASRFFR